MSTPHTQSRAFLNKTRGFSLIEMMVALLVISIGLLGVARIQALAISSTGTARIRSMVAFAAASLAANMHADRAFWAYLSADPAVMVNIINATVTTADNSLSTAPVGACTGSNPCATSAQLAAQDLRDWASGLKSMLPANTKPTASVSCKVPTTDPVTCAIHIAWNENLVASRYATNTLATADLTAQALQQAGQTSYTLYAQP